MTTTSAAVMHILRSFATFGLPRKVVSNNDTRLCTRRFISFTATMASNLLHKLHTTRRQIDKPSSMCQNLNPPLLQIRLGQCNTASLAFSTGSSTLFKAPQGQTLGSFLIGLEMRNQLTEIVLESSVETSLGEGKLPRS